MRGGRVYPGGDVLWLDDGQYGKDPKDGHWYARPPGQRMGCLKNHDVTEHEDGTITVSPSIEILGDGGVTLWHGFLERGVWREC